MENEWLEEDKHWDARVLALFREILQSLPPVTRITFPERSGMSFSGSKSEPGICVCEREGYRCLESQCPVVEARVVRAKSWTRNTSNRSQITLYIEEDRRLILIQLQQHPPVLLAEPFQATNSQSAVPCEQIVRVPMPLFLPREVRRQKTSN